MSSLELWSTEYRDLNFQLTYFFVTFMFALVCVIELGTSFFYGSIHEVSWKIL